MSRPSMDRVMMDVALTLAKRSTCVKAAVGCVLCDAHGRILSTGYNGVPRGMPHCNREEPVPVYHNDPRVKVVRRAGSLVFVFNGQETPALDGLSVRKKNLQCVGFDAAVHPDACRGATASVGSDLCEAVHAEANALMQCKDIDAVHTAYCSTSPCMRCAKELLNTGIERLVFGQRYTAEPQAFELLQRAGISLTCLPGDHDYDPA